MIDGIGVHGMHKAQVTGHSSGIWNEFRKHDPVLAIRIAVETELARRHRESALSAGHGGDALTVANGIRKVFVEPREQIRLVVIEVKLTWRTLHVHVDHTLRLWRKVRPGRERRATRRRIRKCSAVRTNKSIVTSRSVAFQQTCQRRPAKPCPDR